MAKKKKKTADSATTAKKATTKKATTKKATTKKASGFDADTHIEVLREILSEDATEGSWRRLLEHINTMDDASDDDLEMIIDYAESNLDGWPEEQRRSLYSWWLAKREDKEMLQHRLVGNFEGAPILTEKDVLDMVPDRKAVSTTKSTAKPGKWLEYGRQGVVYWGRATGSGGEYSVWVDLQHRSFECSCPSRKRPCKHTLGLLLMSAQGEDIPEKEAPSGLQWEAEESYYDSWE